MRVEVCVISSGLLYRVTMQVVATQSVLSCYDNL